MTILNTRRKFIRNFSVGTVAVSTLPLTACGGGDGAVDRQVAFAHGVASGDPLSDRVIL